MSHISTPPGHTITSDHCSTIDRHQRSSWQKTLISQAIVLASAYGYSLAPLAIEECPATVNGSFNSACLLSGNGATLTVTNQGAIIGQTSLGTLVSGSAALLIESGSTKGTTVSNSGVISSLMQSEVFPLVIAAVVDGDFNGSIHNNNGAMIAGFNRGLWVRGQVTENSQIINDGMVSAGVNAIGTSALDVNNNWGIYIANELAGAVNNGSDGHIVANISANGNSLLATSNAGLWIGGDLSGQLQNDGTISTTINASTMPMVAINNISGVAIGGMTTGTLTNSGMIAAQAVIKQANKVQITPGAFGKNAGIWMGDDLVGELKNQQTISISADVQTASTFTLIGFAGIVSTKALTGQLTNNGAIHSNVSTQSVKQVHIDGHVGVAMATLSSGTLNNTQMIQASAVVNDAEVIDRVSSIGIVVQTAINNGGVLNNSDTVEGSISIHSVSCDLEAQAFGFTTNGFNQGQLINTGTMSTKISVDSAQGPIAVPIVDAIQVNGAVNKQSSLSNQQSLNAALTISAAGSNITLGQLAGIAVNGVDSSSNIDNKGAKSTISSQLAIHTASGTAITGSVFGIQVANNMAGTLNNSGAIRANTTLENINPAATTSIHTYGIRIGSLNGTLNNTGLVLANSSVLGNAWSLYVTEGTGTINNVAPASNSTMIATSSGGFFHGGFFIEPTSMVTLSNLGLVRASAGNAVVMNADHYMQGSDGDTGLAGIEIAGDIVGTNTGIWSVTGTLDLSSNNTIEVLVTQLASTTGALTLENLYTADTIVTSDTLSVFQNQNGQYSFWEIDAMVDASGQHIDLTLNAIPQVTVGAGETARADRATGIAIYVPHGEMGGTLTVCEGATVDGGISLGKQLLIGGCDNQHPFEPVINGDIIGVSEAHSDIQVNSDFSSGGMLVVNTITVADGAIFVQNHPVTADVTLRGTWQPNGAEYLDGNMTWGSNGLLAISATSQSVYDQLTVTGFADLSANSEMPIMVSLSPGSTLVPGDRLEKVLAADTLVLASHPRIRHNSYLFDFEVLRSDDSRFLDIRLQQGRLLADALSQSAFAYATSAATTIDDINRALAEGSLSISSDMQQAIAALGRLDAKSATHVGAQLVPVIVGQSVQAQLLAADRIETTIVQRIAHQQGRSSGNDYQVLSRDPSGWVQPFASWGKRDKVDGVPGYDIDSRGVFIGADGELNRYWLLGGAFGYTQLNIEGDTVSRNTIDSDIVQLAIYGSATPDVPYFVDFLALFGWSSHDSRRTISEDLFRETASGDYDGWHTHWYVGAGWDYSASSAWTLTPVLSLAYTYVDDDSYTEKGAQALSLDVRSNDEQALILAVDGLAAWTLDTIVLTAYAGVGHDFLTQTSTIKARFVGGGAPFVTHGSEPNTWVYRAGLGIEAPMDERLDLYVNYDYQGRDAFNHHWLSATARWWF